MSRRSQLAKLFDRVGVTETILRLRKHAVSPWLTVLIYHRLRPRHVTQPFDDGVVDATPEDFDEQLATVKRYFNLVSVEDLLAHTHGAKLPPNPLAVTFDDGYLDNYQLALPILQKHGVRATFFIATSYVDQRRLFWWDRICYLAKNCTRDTIEISYPELFTFDLKNDRTGSTRALLKVVKDQFNLNLDRYLDELTIASGVEWNPALERRFADELIMTWDQVRALRKAGMDVQSHTRTHRVLRTLAPAQLADELRGSRADLERELGEPIRALSYPVGIYDRLLPAVRQAVHDAGYEIAFANAGGVNQLWGKFDPLAVQRQSVDYGAPAFFFRGIMAIPYLSP